MKYEKFNVFKKVILEIRIKNRKNRHSLLENQPTIEFHKLLKGRDMDNIKN